MIPKVPYKFYYKFVDDSGKFSRLMIEDWEIGQLFWNCLRDAENDLYFFLGTTMEWHRRRSNNPFVIIGVFYPMKESQSSLFN
jgi:hypothetical protein